MHSAGLELTKLTYIRLEDNLIRHRGDRLQVGDSPANARVNRTETFSLVLPTETVYYTNRVRGTKLDILCRMQYA